MKVALFSPYHGGSHRAWADGLKRHARAEISVYALPARFWKWRMHGGALRLGDEFLAGPERPDLILATDMCDLSTLLACTRRQTAGVPSILYMHENQLTYPLPADTSTGPMRRQGGERDLHYAFVNYASMVVADLVLWNSRHHRDAWFDELPRFLNHWPDEHDSLPGDELLDKSRVIPPGIEPIPESDDLESEIQSGDPIILWNHRWDYDKDPETCLQALIDLKDQGVPFRVAVCGENERTDPAEFLAARRALGERVVHFGPAVPEDYRRLLRAASVVVSTSLHEYFGIGVIEAVRARTFPVLPARLSYPEVLPARYHERCLYRDPGEFRATLRWAVENPAERNRLASELAAAMTQYDWANVAPLYDSAFAELVARNRGGTHRRGGSS